MSHKFKILAAFLTSFAETISGRASIDGDTLQFNYSVTSDDYYYSANVIVPGYPTGFGPDASASFYFTNGQIIVNATPANWTPGGFNGFTVIDLSKSANFTSFTIDSVNGGILPELTNGPNFLTVNFTPDGLSNGNIDVTYIFDFTTSEAPTLGITTVSNQPVIFWPACASNFVLQTTTDLGSTNWITITNAPVQVSGRLQTGITFSNTQSFFRLLGQ
jgi:hypothetical protein